MKLETLKWKLTNFRFGGTESATFCALTTLCNQLETDNAIDVYYVAKLFHDHRPGIWTSKVRLYKDCRIVILINYFNMYLNI